MCVQPSPLSMTVPVRDPRGACFAPAHRAVILCSIALVIGTSYVNSAAIICKCMTGVFVCHLADGGIAANGDGHLAALFGRCKGGVQCQDGLHSYAQARHIEGLKHDLRRSVSIFWSVHGRLRQHKTVILAVNPQVPDRKQKEPLPCFPESLVQRQHSITKDCLVVQQTSLLEQYLWMLCCQ